MKRIGIITFHWATNYGAVLQSYAMQQYLACNGYDVEIIDYVPWSTSLSQLISWKKNHRTDMISREAILERFRMQYLIRTKRIRFSLGLRCFSERYFAVICGSDQIWNQSFTLFGEYKPTLAYFANFAGKRTKRISYAASFGSSEVCERYKNYTIPELKKFSSISVREQTGKMIVEKMGLEAEVVCDPTLLLTKEDYLHLINGIKICVPKVFSYVLHGHKEAEKIAKYVEKKISGDESSIKVTGLLEWLYAIQNSEYLVTNSFHGVMLSIILNKPFIAVLIHGSGMNDRIITLLNAVGLENRIIEIFDKNKLDMILQSQIEWNRVNLRLEALREHGRLFLEKSISSSE